MPKTHIVIHHSLTKDGIVADIGAIREYHMSWRYDGKIISRDQAQIYKTRGLKVEAPWAAIGYHWILENINGAIEVLQGRPCDDDGAHCKDLNMNSAGIGICLVGNFDVSVPSIGIWVKLKDLTRWLMKIYGIPAVNVLGHREVQAKAGVPKSAQKTCPGILFPMDNFRDSLV